MASGPGAARRRHWKRCASAGRASGNHVLDADIRDSDAWHRPFFETLGLYRLRGTIQYRPVMQPEHHKPFGKSDARFDAGMQSCRVGIVAAVLLVVPALPHAQWLAHPDRNVPRTPDGKVNLQAPTPRTADGKPDFTGVWQNAWFTDGRVQPLPVSPAGEPPAATFADVFANFTGDLPLQPWAAKLKADRHEQNSKENPDAHCLPMGLVQFHMHPQPRKVIQTPDVIAILYKGNAGVRQILTDGRSLPTDDPQPWWYGYSVGRWDGERSSSRPADSATADGSIFRAAR